MSLTSTDSDTHPARRRRLPGEQGVWIFILVDITFFALLFVAYVVQQTQARDVFAESQASLNVNLGLLNTIVLLTSSWFVALAVAAARADDLKAVTRLLGLGIGCGLLFVVSKAIEYTAKIQSGVSMLTDDFYMLYFVITGLHLLHVVGGTIVLTVMLRKARANTIGPNRMTALESSATFWHMVDFLWVMIFPLLYLLRWR